MGMYTELHFNTELKKDTPQEVIDILTYMVGETDIEPDTPDHPLFDTDRWDFMFRCDSYYFDADTHSTLRKDNVNNDWYLCIRCNLKNYDDEIEKFIDWIDPYVAGLDGKFLGFHRYEESEMPSLIWKGGKYVEERY